MEEERKFPPLPPLEPPDAPMRRRRKYITLTAVLCTLTLALGIWIGIRLGSPEPTEPPVPDWEGNLLRSDPVLYQSKNHSDWDDEAKEHSVFGSAYRRERIASVTFLATLADAPEDAWDVSEAGDGSVMAWVVRSEEMNDLYIAAEGGVKAPENCSDLFAGYANVQKIRFDDYFHTTGSTDMSCMFLGCCALTDLNVSSFDTSSVQDMGGMFSSCKALTDLDLCSFDTSNVQDMSNMFARCEVLTDLTLGNHFDTSNVRDMKAMFYLCKALTELDLSSFDTANVRDMSSMFYFCPTLTDLTLGDNFVTTKANTAGMFANCPAGGSWQHLVN